MWTVGNLRRELILDQKLMTKALICLIIMLGAGLRFYDLGAESYWFDEIVMVQVAGRSLGSIVAEAQGGRPSVYLLLAHFWMRVFGTTEAATRSLSALAGIACLALMYAVGRQMFGMQVGLLSALLMAISEFQIYYSQEYRYYGVFLLMTLVSFCFYVRALRSRRLRHFAPYVLASILLFYTHTFGVFVLVAQALYFLLRWKGYRKARGVWLRCQVLILLATGPGLLVALQTTLAGTGPLDWIPDRPVWYPIVTVLRYVFPGIRYPSWVTLAVGTVFFVVGIWLFAAWKGKEEWLRSVRDLIAGAHDLSSRGNELLLVSLWLLCPIVLPFALSRVFGPMYIHRYTISAAPAFYVLLAVGLTTVDRVVPRFISLGALAILIAPGLHGYYVTPVKWQWREAAAYVKQSARKDDVVVFADNEAGMGRHAFSWYYGDDPPGCSIDTQVDNYEATADALWRCVSGSEHFWLISRHSSRGIEPELVAFLLSPHHGGIRLIGSKKFGLVSVYLFAVTSDDENQVAATRARITARRTPSILR